jgi:predicted amidohydrolase YtcJ
MPNLILFNGKLFTQDKAFPMASALAIRGDRILALGKDDEIKALAKPGTQKVDLRGRLAMPGLTDSHFHFYKWALGRRQLLFADAASLSEVLKRVSRKAGGSLPGTWILGQGWTETYWPEPRMPTRADLDHVAPDNPVFLARSDGHLAATNSLGLQAAGIAASTPNPPRGLIDRDETGQPTGILRELAINLVRDIIPPPSEDETVSAMMDGFKALHRLGLTGIHDFRSLGGADGPPAFRALQHLQIQDEVAARIWMNIPGERLSQAIELGLRTGFGDNTVRVGHVKLFADGSQGARTAWMLEPYDDTGQYGLPLTPMAEIAEIGRRAQQADLAIAVHAIGDRSNRELIGIFESLLNDEYPDSSSSPAAPHRIEHLQMIRPEDVKRLGRLKVVASMQPIHATDDIAMLEKSVGARGVFAYPFRQLLDAGVTLAFGSDCPVADPNPLVGIYAAVTRQRRDGKPAGGWYPGQRLSLPEAVWAYTMGPAIASGRQADSGSLSPGKLADIIVLDRNIFDQEPSEMPLARVDMTIFSGKVVLGA